MGDTRSGMLQVNSMSFEGKPPVWREDKSDTIVLQNPMNLAQSNLDIRNVLQNFVEHHIIPFSGS